MSPRLYFPFVRLCLALTLTCVLLVLWILCRNNEHAFTHFTPTRLLALQLGSDGKLQLIRYTYKLNGPNVGLTAVFNTHPKYNYLLYVQLDARHLGYSGLGRPYYQSKYLPSFVNVSTSSVGYNQSTAQIQVEALALPLGPVLTLSTLLTLFFAHRFLYRSTPAPHLCPTCGYDIRATPDQCPECGRTPATATV